MSHSVFPGLPQAKPFAAAASLAQVSVVSLQLSTVQALGSLQSRGPPLPQTPGELQVSPTVQNWPSPQPDPAVKCRHA